LASSGDPTILIAEDDDELRSLLTTILAHEGYRVLEAGDGIRLVRLLAEQEVDVLVLDIRLGADDGVALGREIRLDRPDLPILLMSGDSSAAEALKDAGGVTDLFLAKPFTSESVTAAVVEILERR
jgi:DNA-binding response OmpR family regulator